MKVVVDLHLHSKYSRAVSKFMTLPVMAQYAADKGLDLLTAGDFTHPQWLKEIKEQLVEKGEGIYKLKDEAESTKNISFLLSTEISSIYKQDGKLRRIHNLIFLPSFAHVDKFNEELEKRGCNVKADGRPIVGLSSKALLELALSISDKAMLIPCHVWTPHFGVYGSASGFDSLTEAFGDLEKYVYGIETGISSDPLMNWQIPELATKSILSFSDAHSPAKMGREATVVEIESLTYGNIVAAFNKQSPLHNKNYVLHTIEFYPEEGKYHNSGHRNCKVSLGPDEIRELGNICPVCHKRLTEGVFYRLQELAKTQEFSKEELRTDSQNLVWREAPLKKEPPFVKLVPLLETIAEANHSTVASKKVHLVYAELIKKVGNELYILLEADLLDIAKVVGERVAESVDKVRKGDLVIKPGYDGEYGIVTIWDKEDKRKITIPKEQIALEF